MPAGNPNEAGRVIFGLNCGFTLNCDAVTQFLSAGSLIHIWSIISLLVDTVERAIVAIRSFRDDVQTMLNSNAEYA